MQPKDNRSVPATDPKATPSATKLAHEQADKDIDQDPEISLHSPNDDLDEGELSRLGEDTSPFE